MTGEELLAEVEDLIRNMPERAIIHHETNENFAWLGRVSAVIEEWDKFKAINLNAAVKKLGSPMAMQISSATREISTLLQHARHQLRMNTVGPLNVAITNGGVYDYFDEIRKIIESATNDILFVDPYLDAEFVSRATLINSGK